MIPETVIITGGKGFVGTYVREELEKSWQGVEVEAWDPVKSRDGRDHGASLPVDITKPEQYRDRLKELQPGWLIHLAAISSVPVAAKDPALTHRVNVEATQNILAAIEELSPATKVLVTSTADIYGSAPQNRLAAIAGQAPLPELPLSAAKPLNPYAQSKWEMEKIIEEHFQGRVLRVRPFPHIGPGQGLGFVTADFAAQIAAIEASFAKASAPKAGEAVIKVGNLSTQRDFTDVRDVVRAYRLLMEKGVFGEACPAGDSLCGVYHVASGTAVSIQEVLDMLIGMSTVEIRVEQDPSRLRTHDIPVLVGDATKLREATGWEPTIPLKQTLQEILDWWRQYYKR